MESNYMKNFHFIFVIILCIPTVLMAYETNKLIQTTSGFYYPGNTKHENSPYLGFGDPNKNYGNKCHLANDYYMKIGSHVYSVGDGIVEKAELNVGNFGGDTPARDGGAIVIKHTTSENKVFYALYGHLKNLQVFKGDFVVGGQYIGDVRSYLSKNTELPHLHFGINTNIPTYSGYTPTSSCKEHQGYVDPEPFLTNNSPSKYEFHGAGSLIKADGTCFGCNHDIAKMHSSNNKSMVSFQWKYDTELCDSIQISAYGYSRLNSRINMDNITLGITAGPWSNRSKDEYYRATLPASIEYPRGSWNVIAVTMPEMLSELKIKFPNLDITQGVYISAACRGGATIPLDTKTHISKNSKSISLISNQNWKGSASIISHSTNPDTGYGKTHDTAYINVTQLSDTGKTAFQWQASERCNSIEIIPLDKDQKEINTGGSFPITLTFKEWYLTPFLESKYSIDLPYTLNSDTTTIKNGQWYVITVNPTNNDNGDGDENLPVYIKSKCVNSR